MTQNCAIILAAGIGSRLYPYTSNTPKCLLDVNGQTILNYQINAYLHAGLVQNDIFIVIGYQFKKIYQYLKFYYPDINIIYNLDYAKTNNMYSLYLALQKIIIQSNNHNYYINNGDCIYEEEIIANFFAYPQTDLIAVDKNNYYIESMKIIVNQDNLLTNINKTILKKESYGVSIDLYKFSHTTIQKLFTIIQQYIVAGNLTSWTEIAFPDLFKSCKIYPFDIQQKKWIEIDTPEDWEMAKKLFS